MLFQPDACQNRTDNIGIVMSRKFASALIRLKKIQRLPSAKHWKPYFDTLILSYGIDEVSKILNWYIESLEGEIFIQAFSARSFRDKYRIIHQAWRKANPQDCFIDADAQTIFKRASHIHWPNGSEIDFPSFVQKSLDNYRHFVAQLRTYRPATDDNSDKACLHRYLIANRYCSPIDFILFWAEYIQDMLEGWEEWNGKLLSYVWNLKSDITIRREFSTASDYGIGLQTWRDYINFIQNRNV